MKLSGILASCVLFSILVYWSCSNNHPTRSRDNETPMEITAIAGYGSYGHLAGFIITGRGFDSSTTAKIDSCPLQVQYVADTMLITTLTDSIASGSHILTVAKEGEIATGSINIFIGSDGVNGKSIIWKGNLASAPSSPDINWAYRDSVNNVVYIWDGSSWAILVSGIQGDPGISITWKGSLSSAPASPSTNWAYYNTTNNTAFIYTSAGAWDTLVTGITGATGDTGAAGTNGLNGLNGISIIWQGLLASAPSNPDTNWAYYNTMSRISFIYSGSSWDTLAVSGETGGQGPAGRSIIWKGSLISAPASPDTNWAYFNSTVNTAFIYNGSAWDTLSVGVTGATGASGLNGVSIIWQGSFPVAPSNPDTNWGYYNTTDKKSYIYANDSWQTLCVDGAAGATGANGKALIWKGALAVAPSSPDTNWAYYNTTSRISFIYSGSSWDTLAVSGETGGQGPAGRSIIWKGSLISAPTSPDTNWAYFNSAVNTAFIYNGSAWDTLSVGVTGATGASGLNGVSILWQGSFPVAPSNPDTNWGYYNTTDKKSYIYANDSWQTLCVDGAAGATGANGKALIWKGALAVAPSSPDTNWAYYNTTSRISFIYSGSSWDTLAVSGETGGQGPAGKSIVWKGSLISAPASPDTNWAYFNSTVNVAYIYNGSAWDTLSVGVTGATGASGLNGVSIIWQGSFPVAPSNPDTNWGYYNTTDKKSYIWANDAWQIFAVDGAQGASGKSLVWKGASADAPVNPDTNWAYYNTALNTSYIWDGDSWEVLCTVSPGTILSGSLTLICPAVTNNRKPTFTWTAYQGAWGYRYRFITDSVYTAVDSTVHSYIPFTNLNEGQYIFVLQVWLAASTFSTPYCCTTNIDLTPPAIPNVSSPGSTSNRRPTWTWNTPPTTVQFRYQLDATGGAWTVADLAVTSFTPASDLSAGSHTLYVETKDFAGNWSSPGSGSCFIDLSAPAAPVVSGYSLTQNPRPTWTWNTPATTTGFRYQLEVITGPWTEVGVGTTSYTPGANLVDGPHVLYVQARNAVGNWSPSGSFTTTIMSGVYDSAIYVSKLGNDTNPGTLASPKLTVQAGVNTAVANVIRLVKVALGTYTEDVTLSAGVSLYGGYSDDFSSRDVVANVTTITANNGSRSIDGANRNAGLYINTTSNLIVHGLTINSGISLDNSYGIYIKYMGVVITIFIDSCIVTGSGGVQNYGAFVDAKTSLTNSTFSGSNFGIYMRGGGANNSVISGCAVNSGSTRIYLESIAGCRLSNMSITGGNTGIAMGSGNISNTRNKLENIRISNCITGISRSVGYWSGGIGDSLLNIHISNSTNNGIYLGGGVGSGMMNYANACTVVTVTNGYGIFGENTIMTNCFVTGTRTYGISNAANVIGCRVDSAGDYGINGSTVTGCQVSRAFTYGISGGTITGCQVDSATTYGINATNVVRCRIAMKPGGKGITGSNYIANNVITVSNATGIETSGNMVNNTIIGSTGKGIDIMAPAVNTMRIVNNIIQGFATGIYETSDNDPAELRNNLVYNCTNLYYDKDSLANRTVISDLNDYLKTTQHPLRYSEYNVTGDPLFNLPDYSLQAGSPACNAGRNVSGAEYGTLIIDIEGTARPVGTAYDIGAYESY